MENVSSNSKNGIKLFDFYCPTTKKFLKVNFIAKKYEYYQEKKSTCRIETVF